MGHVGLPNSVDELRKNWSQVISDWCILFPMDRLKINKNGYVPCLDYQYLQEWTCSIFINCVEIVSSDSPKKCQAVPLITCTDLFYVFWLFSLHKTYKNYGEVYPTVPQSSVGFEETRLACYCWSLRNGVAQRVACSLSHAADTNTIPMMEKWWINGKLTPSIFRCL